MEKTTAFVKEETKNYRHNLIGWTLGIAAIFIGGVLTFWVFVEQRWFDHYDNRFDFQKDQIESVAKENELLKYQLDRAQIDLQLIRLKLESQSLKSPPAKTSKP